MPTRTVYVTSPPAQAPALAASTAAPAQPQLTNASAVALQYHQDITDHDWHAARTLGGSNITAQNGQTYDSWVSDPGDGTVWAHLSATRLDGIGQDL